MKLENLSDFILPIVILLLYFVLNMRKKKEEPENHSEEARPLPAPLQRARARPKPVPSVQGLPPASRRQTPLQSQIEGRKISSAIEEGRFSSQSSARGSTELVIDIDPAYAQKKKSGKSRARNLLKKRLLREGFLLKEILNRPYE